MKQLPLVFITQHTNSLGLASGLTAEDLGLTPGPLFRADAGNLTLYRFTQTYRGFPVFGPDRLVTFVANNRGVVAMRGAILDARVAYLHVESQASKALAQSSALTHASQLANIPTTELRGVDTFLVAVPRTRMIGWATTVMRAQLRIATVVVEADPDLTSLLPLLHFSRGEAEGLADTAQVTVRTEDLDSEITVGDPFTGDGIETADVDALFDGSPLLGSVTDDNKQFRLGTERVVLYDASMAETSHDLEALPVVSADAPVFMASPGTSAFRSQSQFSLFSNSFARVDGLMTGKWESLLPLHGSQSVVPPAEFAPRVIVFTDTPAEVACTGKPACVNELSLLDSPPALIPDEYKQPIDAQPFEVLALAYLRDSHGLALTLHEFGHVVDLFAQPGTIGRDAECTGQADCTESCVEDSTDEAAPLTETFASLMAVWLGHELTAVGVGGANGGYRVDSIDNEGCGCRDTPTTTSPARLLPAGLLARRRRATRTLQTAALVGCALVGTGCSREHLFDDATNAGGETTAVTTTGEAASDTAASSEDTGTTTSAPAHLYGEFRPAELTSGMKWEQSPSGNAEHWIWWANVIIVPDHSLHLEYYFCGGPKEIQSFTWEPDGDGIRVVPPDGEGTSFRWSASDVTDVTLRPGEGCGELLLQVQQAGADTPYPAEKYLPGHLCTTDVSQTECEFEFAWCDAPPAPSECE